MQRKKVLIFIVSYNAEKHIDSVLRRIPKTIWSNETYDAEALLIDDASADNTVAVAHQTMMELGCPMQIYRNPVNQGYGGNQKIGYLYALRNGFDAVALLHGDGQYPPEMLETLFAPVLAGEADAVFGSRMINKNDAIKGGMPLYKFFGNIALTFMQNKMLGTHLSEFHSGYRIYSVPFLNKLPFKYDSNDFDFDTDIIIQMADNNAQILEIPIPTHYGNEICHVNGLRYAYQIMRNTLQSRVQKFQVYYSPKFDYEGYTFYPDKTGFDSSHQFAIELVAPGQTVVDFGCGEGMVARVLQQEKGCHVIGVEQYASKQASAICDSLVVGNIDTLDLNTVAQGKKVDTIMLLDVVEHLIDPEKFLIDLRKRFAADNPQIIVTTGNVGFILVRLSLLLGSFNYGKRGILDMTHKRLFTFASLRRMMEQYGYRVIKVEGLPVPLPFVLGNKKLADLALKINRFLIRLHKGLFSFSFGMTVQPMPTLEMLLEDATREGRRGFSQFVRNQPH